MLLISSNVYYRIVFVFIVCYYMFTILDYSSALEYSIIRRYTNIVYYYIILLLLVSVCFFKYFVLLMCLFICTRCVRNNNNKYIT